MERNLGKPTLVHADMLAGAVFSHRVHASGAPKWPVTTSVESQGKCRYVGCRVILNIVQGNVVKDLMAKAIDSRPGISVPQQSPTGDSTSNGDVENACKRVAGMVRTVKSTIEAKTGVKVTSSHAVFPWVVEWAAQLLTKVSCGRPREEPIERIKGKRSESPISAFGECVH